jgi:Lar family restriction alleviation protein
MMARLLPGVDYVASCSCTTPLITIPGGLRCPRCNREFLRRKPETKLIIDADGYAHATPLPPITIHQQGAGDRDMKFTDGTNPRSDADAATPIMMGIEKPPASGITQKPDNDPKEDYTGPLSATAKAENSIIFPRCEICGSCAWTPRDDWEGYWECCGCKGLKKLEGLEPMTHGLRPPGAGCNDDDCSSLPGNGHPLKPEECDTVTKLEKPLPCPYCGSNDIRLLSTDDGEDTLYWACELCGASCGAGDTIKEALKGWNQRVSGVKSPYCPKCNCSWFYTCSSPGFRECRHCNTQYAVGDRKEKT